MDSQNCLMEKIYQDVKDLENILLRYNSLKLLTCLSFVETMQKEAPLVPRESIIEYITLLYLKYPFNVGTDDYIDQCVLMDIHNRVMKIFINTIEYYKSHLLNETENDHDTILNTLLYRSMMNELFVHFPTYIHHQKDALLKLFKCFDDWFLEKLGFTIEDILSVDEAINWLVKLRTTEKRNEVAGIKEKILRNYTVVDTSNNDRERELFKEISRLPAKKAQEKIESYSTCILLAPRYFLWVRG